jgi:hypothetical protein
MKQQKVSILVIGGNVSAGVNVKPRQSYVSHLLYRLQQAGWTARVELHTPVGLDSALSLLYRLNLNRFDLIILQLDHACLQHSAGEIQHSALAFAQANGLNTCAGVAAEYGFDVDKTSFLQRIQVRLSDWVTLAKLRLNHALGQSTALECVDIRLEDLLYYLEPFRRRLVLMTPLPHLHPVSSWLRQQGRWLFRQQGRNHLIPVFDTASVIQERSEFFSDEQQGHLSSVAHDLLGLALYEFVQINALLPERSKRHPRQH